MAALPGTYRALLGPVSIKRSRAGAGLIARPRSIQRTYVRVHSPLPTPDYQNPLFPKPPGPGLWHSAKPSKSSFPLYPPPNPRPPNIYILLCIYGWKTAEILYSSPPTGPACKRVEEVGPVWPPQTPRGSDAPGGNFTLSFPTLGRLWGVAPPGPKPPRPPGRSKSAIAEAIAAPPSQVRTRDPFGPALTGAPAPAGAGGIGVSVKEKLDFVVAAPHLLSLKHRSPPLAPGPEGARAPAPPALTKTQSCRPFRARSVIGARALRTARPKVFWPTRAWDVGVRRRKPIFARAPGPRR